MPLGRAFNASLFQALQQAFRLTLRQALRWPFDSLREHSITAQVTRHRRLSTPDLTTFGVRTSAYGFLVIKHLLQRQLLHWPQLFKDFHINHFFFPKDKVGVLFTGNVRLLESL